MDFLGLVHFYSSREFVDFDQVVMIGERLVGLSKWRFDCTFETFEAEQ